MHPGTNLSILDVDSKRSPNYINKIDMVYTVPVKGMAALLACKAHVLHAHYTQCSRSVHAVSTHLTRKCPNMGVITYTYIKSSIIYYT